MCEQNNMTENNDAPEVNEQTEEKLPVDLGEETNAEDACENKEEKTEEPKKKRSIKKTVIRTLIIIAIILLLTAAVLAATVFIMRSIGEKSLKQEPIKLTPIVDSQIETLPEDGDYDVMFNGEKYSYNEDAIAFVVMGVDKESIDDVVGAGDNGQSDVVFLVVADTSDGSVDMVSVSRDAMVDVNKYTTTGVFNGVEKMQLCLAYAYGDGKEGSCENVATSVSRLFYGIPISGYAAIDLDAISVLTDAVGGVTVPAYNEEMTEKIGGTVTLTGETAEFYLRRRDVEELESNTARMQRQSYYLDAFIQKAVSQTKKDVSTPLDLYNGLDGYMVTDVTASETVYMVTEYLGGIENMTRHSVKGTVAKGESGYAEFTVDTAAMDELIIKLFYKKK